MVGGRGEARDLDPGTVHSRPRIVVKAVTARGGLDLNLRDLGVEPPSVAGVVKVANRFRLEFEIRATATGER